MKFDEITGILLAIGIFSIAVYIGTFWSGVVGGFLAPGVLLYGLARGAGG